MRQRTDARRNTLPPFVPAGPPGIGFVPQNNVRVVRIRRRRIGFVPHQHCAHATPFRALRSAPPGRTGLASFRGKIFTRLARGAGLASFRTNIVARRSATRSASRRRRRAQLASFLTMIFICRGAAGCGSRRPSAILAFYGSHRRAASSSPPCPPATGHVLIPQKFIGKDARRGSLHRPGGLFDCCSHESGF